MRRIGVRLTLVLALVALSVAVIGCQAAVDRAAEKATEKVIEGATGAKIDQNGDSVTITGEDGTELTASSEGELPSGFPSDVPVYEGKITGSLKTGEAFTVTIDTADEAATVMDWYLAEFKKGGWTSKSEVKMDIGGVLGYEKGNTVASVTIAREQGDDSTAVLLGVNPKQ